MRAGSEERPTPGLAGDFMDEEERFRLLVDAVTDYAIYMLDPTGHVASWNAGAQRFKGYAADEIIGQHFSRFYTEEDRAAGLPARRSQTRASEGQFEARGLAGAQGRHALLGACRDRPDPRRRRRADRLRQDHARPHRARGRPSRRCSRARSEFRLLVQGVTDYAIYMLDPDGPCRELERRRPAHQGLHRRTRSSASISRASTPRRTAPPACRQQRAGDRRSARAASRRRAGACARTARASGRTSSSTRSASPTGSCSASPRSRATSPSAARRSRSSSRRARRCSSRRRWTRSASSPAASRTISTTC